MASGRGSGPWNWQLIAPPPAPPVAEMRMINADYQAGGELTRAFPLACAENLIPEVFQ